MSEKKKVKKVTTAVSTHSAKDLSSLTADHIPGFLETVSKKIKELQGNIPDERKTTGELEPFGKIADIDSVELLIKAHSMVTGKARAYEVSAKALNIDTKKYPFELDGSSEEEWVADITHSVNIVKNKVELDRLMKVKEKLEANLSAKAKLARDLKDISELLMEE